jgi:hypothetical protein
MKKIDKVLQGETVKYVTDQFRGYLPPDLRSPFDDLMELRSELIPLQNNLVDNKKNLQRYDKAFSRLCVFFKANPLIESSKSDV